MRHSILSILGVAVIVGAAPPFDPVPASQPIALIGAEPAPGARVSPPSEIRLWFSEPPQDTATVIRLVNLRGHVLPAGPVIQDPKDPKAMSVSIPTALPPGRYTVRWRAIGRDGLAATDLFGFVVAERPARKRLNPAGATG